MKTFIYPDYGTPEGYPELASRSGETCTIIRELDDSERDDEVGRMYVVRFGDGIEATVFEDELV